jgi:hypothetical protein
LLRSSEMVNFSIVRETFLDQIYFFVQEFLLITSSSWIQWIVKRILLVLLLLIL